MTKDTGGPAFPVADLDHQTFQLRTVGEARRLLSGMDLRDYFAATISGHLMMAMLNAPPLGVELQFSEIAWKAYSFADAMIAERAK